MFAMEPFRFGLVWFVECEVFKLVICVFGGMKLGRLRMRSRKGGDFIVNVYHRNRRNNRNNRNNEKIVK